MSELSLLKFHGKFREYELRGGTQSFEGWLVSNINFLQSRITELEGKLQRANEDASTLNVAVKLLAQDAKNTVPPSVFKALKLHRARIQQDGA